VYNNARSQTVKLPALPHSRAVLDPGVASDEDEEEGARLSPGQTLVIDAILGGGGVKLSEMESGEMRQEVFAMRDFASSRKIAKRIVQYVDKEVASQMSRIKQDNQDAKDELERRYKDLISLSDSLKSSLLSVELGGNAATISSAISSRAGTIERAHRSAVRAVDAVKRGEMDATLEALGDYMAATGMVSREDLDAATSVREPKAEPQMLVGGEKAATPSDVQTFRRTPYTAKLQSRRAEEVGEIVPAEIPVDVAPESLFSADLKVSQRLDDFLTPEILDADVTGKPLGDFSLEQVRNLARQKLLSKARPIPVMDEVSERELLMLSAGALSSIAKLIVRKNSLVGRTMTPQEVSIVANDANKMAQETPLRVASEIITSTIRQISRRRR